tara:strand:+ start:1228 stop:1377 length:150 start_codon:yes stop_codon:yes gene_type:complete
MASQTLIDIVRFKLKPELVDKYFEPHKNFVGFWAANKYSWLQGPNQLNS